MRFLRKLTFAVTTAFLIVPIARAHAHAGGVGGGVGDGGGEQITAEENPWRVGPEPIEYCIERASDFPQSQQALSALVAEVFSDWKSFFQKYQMDRAFQSNTPNFPFNLTLPPSAREVTVCSVKKSQIRFVFGIMNPEIRQYKAMYADRVIGFAHRTNYDKKNFQGSGVVWITPHNSYEEHTGPMVNTFPDWNWRASLKHQLLHEVGHVFGMQHNSTWVMDSEVMHVQLWATLRHQEIPNESHSMVPLGTIETNFLVFDPLSGTSPLSTCVGFRCVMAHPIPVAVQKALNINLPQNRSNPEVKIRFSQTARPSNTPANEPEAPAFKMTVSIPSLAVEKTIDIQPQVLTADLVPRLYISGAYNPGAAWLRRVYTGNFNAVLSGNGVSVPLMLTVAPKVIKLSAFDSATETWVDWVVLSAPYVSDPAPANQ